MTRNELETEILFSLMENPQMFDLDASLSDELFEGERKRFFHEALRFWEEERPQNLDQFVIKDRAKISLEKIIGWFNGCYCLSPDSFVWYVKRLQMDRLLGEVVTLCEKESRAYEKTGNWDEGNIEKIGSIWDEIREIKKVSNNNGPILRRLHEIDPKPVEWTWPNRIPRGKLSLIVGDPGIGKSFFCTDLAARITKGRQWPDSKEIATAGSVLLLTAEDGLADTVRIRADAAGADVSKIIILDGIKKKEGTCFFSLCEHVSMLEKVIKENSDLSLVIIDPISAYLGDLDSHKNAEVRGALAPVSALAERMNVAIVGISHLNKSTASEKAVYRVMGSLSFVAAARACWGVISDPDDQDQERRILVPVKTNLSIRPTSLAFKIDGGRIVYESQPFRINADEAFSSRKEDREQQSISETWLRSILQAGPVDVKDIMAQARNEAIPSSSIYLAARKLGILKTRQGKGASSKSIWELKG